MAHEGEKINSKFKFWGKLFPLSRGLKVWVVPVRRGVGDHSTEIKYVAMQYIHFSREDISHFKGHVCYYNQLATETDFFHHTGQHLKNNDSVTCMYVDCSYQSNVQYMGVSTLTNGENTKCVQ